MNVASLYVTLIACGWFHGGDRPAGKISVTADGRGQPAIGWRLQYDASVVAAKEHFQQGWRSRLFAKV